ncbi:hypothetical protein NW762_014102 [Fusarium torreyae]|uniref:Beta-xylosidase C-terminal Concanavalin A-like domain-containing protein n=1 Tax=Fusarium torreyae TaxID=1237075 RepID=A0A9W8V6V2_9HYPO|nr:hypothetical protein NW762_014102 [Fusarium torreyae]
MARSKTIWGPYESCPSNPLLRAVDTDNYIQHTGHGDLVQDSQDRWWAVCLAVRKDENGRYAMGRETFLTPVEWQAEWPVFEPVRRDPSKLASHHHVIWLYSSPSVDLVYIRDALMENYHYSRDGSDFKVTASPVDLFDSEVSPTFIGKRQRLLQGRSSVTVTGISKDWEPTRVKCGLAYYKDEHRYFRVFFQASDRSIVFEQKNDAQEISKTWQQFLDEIPATISFAFEYTEKEFRLMYCLGNGSAQSWNTIAVVDTLTMTDPDFVGPVFGIFAVADESVEVVFDKFEHQ